MTTPKPQTQTGDLLRQLFLIASTPPINSFDLKRLEKAVDSLPPLDQAVLKGAIAATQQRYEQTKSQFDRAVALSGSRPDVLFNYAVSLGVAGHYLEARNYAVRAAEKGPIDLFRAAFSFLVGIGAFASASELLGLALKYKIQVEDEKAVATIANFLKEIGRAEDEVISVASLGRIEAAKRGFLFTSTKGFLSYNLAQPCLILQLVLDTSAELAFEVESAVFDQLGSSPLEIESSGQLTFLVTMEPISVPLPAIGEFAHGNA